MTNNIAVRSPRSRFAILVLVVLALGLSVAACSSSSKDGADDAGSGSAAITIKDLKFTTEPVKAGATVTVQNNDDVDHTVTSDDDKFDVSVAAGESATFTAPDSAGSYKFHCNIHSSMKATLTVE
jgi:plastocyanin